MNRRIVTIDIETLPAPKPNTTDGGGPETTSEHGKTALNGDFGRILCVGYVDEDSYGVRGKGVLGWDEKGERFTCDERGILVSFWELMKGFRPSVDRVVGHCIFDFDLKFIYKRSIVHRVRPALELSFARYRSTPIFDTACEWERWSYGPRISLDRLATALGLPSSKTGGINGSRVSELFEQGYFSSIRDYCLRDVELTRAIYRRMVFADHEPAGSPSPTLNDQRDLALA